MTTVLPEGECLRRAVNWISEQTQSHPHKKPLRFVNEAITRFDLSPKDADFLINFYKKN
ncbi:hypothetical protein MJD09_18945 [bacterium]|nr:hypothetical protein [bacterium]